MGMQVFDAFAVDLRPIGRYVAAPKQELRQHTHAAPDFQHVARRSRRDIRPRTARKRIADLARNVQIDQKMLAQCLFCPYFGHTVSNICRKDNK